ncbi:glycosyltransferase family protein [Paenibacillus lautus]|uniref:glycosyltransferase family protein n=1 Tax=Paenibacillus lautus TaxID=1401 RepID=UPI002DBC7CDB|nr:glycosyltransferase [Paenibacillus lautus]MEC0258400.1 glycosyltransferase [Paenibacillus lautus]
MDLLYIQRKLDEIQRIRTQLKSGLGEDGLAVENLSSSYGFKKNFNKISDLRMACIMDEFTFLSFKPECALQQVTPDNWEAEFEDFKPHIFFLESAWRGKDDLWNTKVPYLSSELSSIIDYCRKTGIPIIFWNKEDPVHFNTFINTAKYADVVFTTDIDCIKDYKTILRHDQVYLLPFAAQTKYHNPIETYSRKDKVCFAGAYYKRYPERNRDLNNFIDVLSSRKELDIYDRNYYNNDSNYKFPSSFKKYIVGNLKADEIHHAYKGYKFNINMNSVKQSQSMCARRIFELLASNTVALSNYSRAVKNLFGDLVICTDDPKYLDEETRKFDNDIYYSKFRLSGLRKTLSQHTYRKRLEYLISKVYNVQQAEEVREVALIAYVTSEKELSRVMENFERQLYQYKTLFVYTNLDVEVADTGLNNIHITSTLTRDSLELLQEEYPYWCFFSPNDYYGEYYVNDFVLALEYVDSSVITKSSYYSFNSKEFVLNSVATYNFHDSANLRRSFISSNDFSINELNQFVYSIEEGYISKVSFSIDEFNYCMSYTGNSCEIVDDATFCDQGLNIADIYSKAEKIKPHNRTTKYITLSSKEMMNLIDQTKKTRFKHGNGILNVDVRTKGKIEYVYLKDTFNILEFTDQFHVNIKLEADFGSLVKVEGVVSFLDKHGNEVRANNYACNHKVSIEIPNLVEQVRLGFRFSGDGVCNIKQLHFGDFQFNEGCYLNKSDSLLITDNFPSYDDLYRSAFVYSRVREYKNAGQLVDIFKYNERYPAGYSEFTSHDIICGNNQKLVDTLLFSEYQTILIHFLTEGLWNNIKKFVKYKKIIVWIHGADIQPWWRRKHNFITKKQLDKAQLDTEKKMSFWNELFLLAERQTEYNIHFVFVSDFLAQTVFEDTGVHLSDSHYSIIHNYINNDLFTNDLAKESSDRKKILTIRPFANNNYANDLTVNAILYLSKEPFFKDLEFRIIGKGELFESTIKPLRKFKNVLIEEKFLRQEEIATLHKEYGVFLVPTRVDSQGVSRDEAMSSGLVPITNKVAAVPEFVDNDCGMLVEKEDYKGLAESIKKLYFDPELFLKLSENASKRVRRQSGFETTILREINLIKTQNRI